VKKDNDWVENRKVLNIGPHKAPQFLAQVERDSNVRVLFFFFVYKRFDTEKQFFESQGIMDYSLLIGIHHLGRDDVPAKSWVSTSTSAYKQDKGNVKLPVGVQVIYRNHFSPPRWNVRL